MFENLSERLGQTLRNVSGKGRLTEDNIKETLREVRMALLEADVALPVVKAFVAQVKERAVGTEVTKSLKPGQVFIKIVQSELESVMGEANEKLNLATQPPAVVLMAGLQGAGKTTSVGKLAKYLTEREKKKVMVVSADVYRPAAIKQLETLAGEVNVAFHPSTILQKPIDIVNDAIAEAKKNFFDVLLVDTAGRLHVDNDMMNEITELHAAVKPIETLFVVDAMTGQDAVNSSESFNKAIDITGIILTKMDGDAKGGAALSIKDVIDKPIKFIGTGESINNLENFYPDRFASRILGMGDVVSLVEKAESVVNKESIENLEEKIKNHEFSLSDFQDQIKQIKKMGPLSQVMDMIPGANKLKMGDFDEKNLKWVEAIISSMTIKERINPSIIDGSRRKRIANGSGRSTQEVNSLLKQYKQMKSMMKTVGKNKGKLKFPFM